MNSTTPTLQHFVVSAWSWNLWVIAVCAAILLLSLVRRDFRPKSGWMLAGVLIFFLTICSPLNALADGYLFSAHMLQHLLLLLIVPALILLGLPRTRAKPGGHLEKSHPGYHPLFAWFLGVGGMWFWHIPALCNAAVADAGVHVLQYVSLLLMGAAFWLPVIGPLNERTLRPLPGIAYLFSACLACTLLGILIAFSPLEICSIYHHPVDRLGILPLLRDRWGLTPLKDQQLGGLMMWVPACVVYFCGIIGLLRRWYRSGDGDAVPGKV